MDLYLMVSYVMGKVKGRLAFGHSGTLPFLSSILIPFPECKSIGKDAVGILTIIHHPSLNLPQVTCTDGKLLIWEIQYYFYVRRYDFSATLVTFTHEIAALSQWFSCQKQRGSY